MGKCIFVNNIIICHTIIMVYIWKYICVTTVILKSIQHLKNINQQYI